jgi:hypothetical protein
MSHQTQGLALEYLHSCLNTLGDSTGHLPGMHLKDPKHRNTNPVGRQNTHSQRSQHRTNQHNRRHTQLLKFTRRQTNLSATRLLRRGYCYKPSCNYNDPKVDPIALSDTSFPLWGCPDQINSPTPTKCSPPKCRILETWPNTA